MHSGHRELAGVADVATQVLKDMERPQTGGDELYVEGIGRLLENTTQDDYEAELLDETLSNAGLTGKVIYSFGENLEKYINITITGTPTQAGQFYYRIKLSSAQSDNELVWKLNIKIEEPELPKITTATVADAVSGTIYSESLAATGTTPITWSIVSGELPQGLELNPSTGEISGTAVI